MPPPTRGMDAPELQNYKHADTQTDATEHIATPHSRAVIIGEILPGSYVDRYHVSTHYLCCQSCVTAIIIARGHLSDINKL